LKIVANTHAVVQITKGPDEPEIILDAAKEAFEQAELAAVFEKQQALQKKWNA